MISVVAAFFFTNTVWYTGPGTELTGGADVGFIVGGVLAAILYPLALKLWPEPRSVFAPPESAAGGTSDDIRPLDETAKGTL